MSQENFPGIDWQCVPPVVAGGMFVCGPALELVHGNPGNGYAGTDWELVAQALRVGEQEAYMAALADSDGDPA